MSIDTLTSEPPEMVVLVHGAVTNGQETWQEQRPLSQDYALVTPDRERAAIPGAGHAVQYTGQPFNALLRSMWESAAS